MRPDKWKDVVGNIKDKFKVEKEYHEELENIPNSDVHVIVFTGPTGRIKLEFETKPIVLDRKTIYSKLAGAAQSIEYKYSEDEFSNKMTAFTEQAGQWVEMDGNTFN